MVVRKKRVKPMKDVEVITDPSILKVLLEATRANIVFKHLVKSSMTVTQLGDSIGKNPGTILRHIDKLKKAGIVVEVRTEQTRTGIIQRYYRATAREFRLGFSGMMQSDGGVAEFARAHIMSMIKALSIYGVDIPESKLDESMELLGKLLEQENEVISNLSITEEKSFYELPQPVRNDTSRIMRRLVLEEDAQYRRLREKWHSLLQLHRRN